MHWEENLSFEDLPGVAVGDIVHLKSADGLSYLVKAVVSNVLRNEIEAIATDIFDYQGQNKLVAGDMLRLVGSTLSFSAQTIHYIARPRGEG